MKIQDRSNPGYCLKLGEEIIEKKKNGMRTLIAFA